MQTIATIGLDIAKSVFQVHGVHAAGQVVVRRQLKRHRRQGQAWQHQQTRGSPGAALPPDWVIDRARALIDWRQISVEPGAVRVGNGQRLTLNDLGQGYLTDRVADLLAARGLQHVLVDLGEQRALTPRQSGAPWVVARESAAPIQLLHGALATSEGSGCVLGADGAAHHLFDPHTGRSPAHWKTITVHHRSAAIADALTNALYIATADEIKAMLPHIAGAVVWERDHDDREWCWTSPPVHGVAPEEAS
jgi:thiamine biosynthesis lipoprotein